ncbi:hypothetical protein RFI_08257 [Reticulomyxa filosa]|uniref:Uncharacterized protein n=1 Tax=Reticulomyxa filosa TaxID=46433 RepID=X6NT16_RETFI|nr:hypothetical protein RFI_08257 [Reticulomyxa filosa]|eukprot:ETO28869.1 hypothetical protein RFI_08257 [Reticulomyxa filosa]
MSSPISSKHSRVRKSINIWLYLLGLFKFYKERDYQVYFYRKPCGITVETHNYIVEVKGEDCIPPRTQDEKKENEEITTGPEDKDMCGGYVGLCINAHTIAHVFSGSLIRKVNSIDMSQQPASHVQQIIAKTPLPMVITFQPPTLYHQKKQEYELNIEEFGFYLMEVLSYERKCEVWDSMTTYHITQATHHLQSVESHTDNIHNGQHRASVVHWSNVEEPSKQRPSASVQSSENEKQRESEVEMKKDHFNASARHSIVTLNKNDNDHLEAVLPITHLKTLLFKCLALFHEKVGAVKKKKKKDKYHKELKAIEATEVEIYLNVLSQYLIKLYLKSSETISKQQFLRFGNELTTV